MAGAITIFLLVYLGMLLGRLPSLGLDRTGIALLGAIALLATGALDLTAAAASVDLPTIALLFGLMVVSAQLRLGGFYDHLTRRIAGLALAPSRLLLILVLTVGLLSAVFSNDVICLAVAPVLVDVCRRRGLDVVAFLLALACAANVGSAATLIGNPQNMLIGEGLDLSFSAFLRSAAPAAVGGLGITWAVIAWQSRGRWELPAGLAADPNPEPERPLDRWQTGKGLAVAALLVAAFLFTDWQRAVVALAGAGLLLTSRKLHSREMLGLVDWQLLVLFASLFIVNGAFQATGVPAEIVTHLGDAGIDASHPSWLFVITVGLSNAVSNVPAVMLLLPLATHPQAGTVLALASTLAGNLLLIGSIANLIVADAAAARGIAIDWRRHARTGVPITLLTLALAALSLWLEARLGFAPP